jgi:hypothetical protein
MPERMSDRMPEYIPYIPYILPDGMSETMSE